jgi:hypothetical protein
MGHDRTSARPSHPSDSGEPPDVARLRGLVLAARSAQGGARTALAGEINQLLTRLSEPGNESEEARLLVAELDSHAFDELLDERGVSSRKAAVLALLSLGFPHALNVDPDDLAFARREERREKARESDEEDENEQPPAATDYTRKLKKSRAVALGLAGLSSLALVPAAVVALMDGSTLVPVFCLLQVLLSAGAAGYLVAAMPPLEQQAAPIAAIVFGVLIALCLIPAAGLFAVIAAGGSAGALAALIGWQYDDPGRTDGLFRGENVRRGRNPFGD